MKKTSIIYFIIGAVIASCSRESTFEIENSNGLTGFLDTSQLNLEIKGEIPVTRSVGTPSANDFTLNFYNTNNPSQSVVSYKYSEMPEIITLPVGTYKINAEYGGIYGTNGETAAFNAPHYLGESVGLQIEEGKIVDTFEPIICSPINVKVSVKFDTDLIDVMGEDAKVTVKMGEDGNDSLDFTKNTQEDGYFKYSENSNTLVAVFSGTVQDIYISESKTYNNVRQGTYYTITFKLHKLSDEDPEDDPSFQEPGIDNPDPEGPSLDDPKEDEPGIEDPGIDEPKEEDPSETPQIQNGYMTNHGNFIVLDAEITWHYMTGEGFEDLDPENGSIFEGDIHDPITGNDDNQGNENNPGGSEPTPEEPGNEEPTPEQPEIKEPAIITSDYVNIEQITDISSWTGTLQVKILTDSPIKVFKCKIDSSLLTPEVLNDVGLTDDLDLVNDIYPKTAGQSESETWEKLRSLGFPVGSDVTDPKLTQDGKSLIIFDITEFIPLMNALGNGYHNFIFTVTNEAGTTVKTLKLKN